MRTRMGLASAAREFGEKISAAQAARKANVGDDTDGSEGKNLMWGIDRRVE
jgi:hypothetical protein